MTELGKVRMKAIDIMLRLRALDPDDPLVKEVVKYLTRIQAALVAQHGFTHTAQIIGLPANSVISPEAETVFKEMVKWWDAQASP